MMTMLRRAAVISAVATVLCASDTRGQPSFGDGQAITQFERAVDGYAFQHRQVGRRAGETPEQKVMSGAMRATRPAAEDGAIFTPLVADAFHKRIASALKSGCASPAKGSNFIVPRPNQDASGTQAIADCLAAVLPRLPAELEYRAAGVVLLLVDMHANLVVDVLHGAFP